MTDPKSDSPDVLEQNVSTLLEHGGDPPRMNDLARARIRAAIVAKHAASGTPARRPLVAVGVGALAAAAAALVVTHVVGRSSNPETTTPTTPTGALADGSTWIVEPGAQVTVLGPRHVRVTGAALLDVVPGKGTFVVDTAQGHIEVLGTRFLVAADADKTTTAVVRGQVKLATANGDVLLHAGEQGIAEHARPPTREPAPRLSHLVSWAAEARHKDEHAIEPIHHGTLFAKDPGVRSHPPWGDEYPLPMAHLGVDVVVENQVARVALDQTFHNNENQALEGTYRFAIPPDASLQRFAMYVDGKLEESAVVERMKARRIYEELVYRRVDPGLLEWAGTGRLDLRVYPIPARQDKRLVLAYTQSLPKLYDDYTLAIPFPEIDQPVGAVDFTVRVKGCATCELTSTSHQLAQRADGDDAIVTYKNTSEKIGDSLVIHVRDPRKQTTVATAGSGDARYLMVRAPSDLGAKQASTYRPRTWVILDDVSASRDAMARRAQADLVDAFLRELDEDDRVAIVAFDVATRQIVGPTRVLDVDRRAVRTKLNAEGGVGATDFGAALASAAQLLVGVAPDDANIVYLGDGVITSGTRKLDELRAQLVGRAHFVGVGVGDGPDTQTLEALAGATGGYATTIELADDVAWRAFDLVAALHTQRATGVTARLVDDKGQLVPATTYVRSPQVADGEELELVAKLAGSGTPAAVELSGTRDGRAWSQRIALGSGAPTGATPAADAGYLPRLWAQRHIAARMLAKHEPVDVPACAKASACQTEVQLREARDESIRKEVVALGKQYFLLSRHTSLIVLENDAMYARFEVTKGSGETWAPYALPATIPVVTAPAAAIATTVPADSEIVRSPVSIFYDYGAMAWERDRWGGDVGGIDENLQLGFRGPIRGGIATGAVVTADVTTRAHLGLDEAAMGDADKAKAGPVSESEPAEAKKTDAPMTTTVARQPIATDELAGAVSRHATLDDGLLLGKGSGNGYGYFGTIGHGAGRGGRRTSWMANEQQMLVQHLTYPQDPLFDDLAMWVPALVRDNFDIVRADLVRSSTAGAPHAVDPAAAQQLTRARAALPSGMYRWDEFEIALDGARHFGWHRTTEAALHETASFDGATWTRRYAELGLDVTRALGDDAAALDLAYLPILVAEPAQLARYFAVTSTGPHQVTLATVVRGTAKPHLVLDFDAHDHLVAIRDAAGRTLLAVTWDASGPTSALVDGARVAVGFSPQAIGDAVAWAHGAASAQPVVVQLPLHLATFAAKDAAAQPIGSAQWQHAERQLLASYAAVGDRANLAKTYRELAGNGGALRGDLALAAPGMTTLSDQELAVALAPFGTTADRDPVARYVFAGRAYAKDHKPSSLELGRGDTGLVAQLFGLRTATAWLVAQKGTNALETLQRLDGHAVLFRVIGASAMQQHYEIKGDDLVRAWMGAATGSYANTARANAALALWNRGEIDKAAERIDDLVQHLDLDAPPPQLAQAQYLFANSRRGQAGWQIVWATWRQRVLAGDSFDHVMALLAVAQDPNDQQTILARAAAIAGDDGDRRVLLARTAMARGQGAWAQGLIEPMLAKHPSRELYQLAAQLALVQGRNADALAHLEAAQAAAGDEAVDINLVRGELGQIIEVAKRVAIGSAGPSREAAIAKALAWGGKWRAIDEGNPAIDQQLGELLLAVGDTEGAWRQLSTVIERAPMQGQGYMTVAEAFERQGKVGDAVTFWDQAVRLDQTNPTPRLREAQALIALGRAPEGDAILDDILKRTWHDVWSGVVYQARDLRERGKPRRTYDE